MKLLSRSLIKSLHRAVQLTRRVYYRRRVRDFAQILGHVFGSDNMKKATIVVRDALKNSSYGYFMFFLFKNVKKQTLLQTITKQSKEIIYYFQN